MSTLGTVERPLCVAVIGSGPSGFYAAEALLKAPNLTVRVDVFDRLPTPFGMVRGGVAPDHQNIKGVTATYEKVASDPLWQRKTWPRHLRRGPARPLRPDRLRSRLRERSPDGHSWRIVERILRGHRLGRLVQR